MMKHSRIYALIVNFIVNYYVSTQYKALMSSSLSVSLQGKLYKYG